MILCLALRNDLKAVALDTTTQMRTCNKCNRELEDSRFRGGRKTCRRCSGAENYARLRADPAQTEKRKMQQRMHYRMKRTGIGACVRSTSPPNTPAKCDYEGCDGGRAFECECSPNHMFCSPLCLNRFHNKCDNDGCDGGRSGLECDTAICHHDEHSFCSQTCYNEFHERDD
jgi:hypothetical protein